MTNTNAQVVLEITATDRETLERDLDRAELLARQEAMRERKGGVLITRHTQRHFTIAVCESVPFGLTRELSSW